MGKQDDCNNATRGPFLGSERTPLRKAGALLGGLVRPMPLLVDLDGFRAFCKHRASNTSHSQQSHLLGRGSLVTANDSVRKSRVHNRNVRSAAGLD